MKTIPFIKNPSDVSTSLRNWSRDRFEAPIPNIGKSCSKNKTLSGSHNGIAVRGVFQNPPRTYLLSILEAFMTGLLS